MPTTNPVPSTDPSDLLFNAGKLDEVVNGTASSFTDRLGATRRTVAGMNADFDAQLADAESDLNVYRADAAASASQALGYLNVIRATSYGAYASDPATDPLGNPPTVGDEYFNTTANLLKRWNGTTWQASDINTANLAAPSGSSLVGYTPAGTGAVATTVQEKLRETVSVKDFGAVGNGVADDSVAFQKAVDEAIKSSGEVYVPAGDYLIGSTVVLGTPSAYTGGVKISGVSPNSVGTRTSIIQKDINTPAFKVDSINTHLTGLSFTCWAGSSKTAAGANIVATAYTPNSITLSANPWGGASPVVWSTSYTATDGTVYSSVIRFNLQGAWVAGSATVNGDGTVTLNNVKGSDGTVNAAISGVVGNSVTFISLAHTLDPATFTNSNASIIYCDLRENQFYDHLWFHQVTRAFSFDETGSGAGPSTGTGNAGFVSNIVLDQGINLIHSTGDIFGLQIKNSQFYGVRGAAFYAPYGSIKSCNISNCQVIIGKFLQANSDLVGLTITGNSFNAMTGYGYSDNLINIGGNIQDCVMTGNNFGRNSTTQCINAAGMIGTVFSGNTVLSNGETCTDPWLRLNATLTKSTLTGNNFAAEYGVSTNNRLGFYGATPDVSGTVFGGEWVGYQVGTKSVGWLSPTFQNSWANVAGGTQAVEYFKDQNGIVYIKGELAGGSSGTVAFTLPNGYRPSGLIRTYGRANTAGGEVPMGVQIATTGTVTIQTAVVSWGDLGMISFPTR